MLLLLARSGPSPPGMILLPFAFKCVRSWFRVILFGLIDVSLIFIREIMQIQDIYIYELYLYKNISIYESTFECCSREPNYLVAYFVAELTHLSNHQPNLLPIEYPLSTSLSHHCTVESFL